MYRPSIFILVSAVILQVSGIPVEIPVVGDVENKGVGSVSPPATGWNSTSTGWTAPPVGWTAPSTGWGPSPVASSGTTHSYGQTIIADNVAATNIVEDEIALYADSSYTSSSEAEVTTLTQPDNELFMYPAPVGVHTADVDLANIAPYADIGGSGNGSSYIDVTNSETVLITTNPTGISSLSAGEIVQSAWGQVTNGTNVAPVGGWKATDSEDKAGWGWTGAAGPTSGVTVSGAEYTSVNDSASVAGVADDVFVNATGDGYYTVGMYAGQNMSLAQYQIYENDGLSLNTTNDSIDINGEYFTQESYPSLATETEVEGADLVLFSETPVVGTASSIGGLTISDWGTLNSGANLVNNNQNSGWSGLGMASGGASKRP